MHKIEYPHYYGDFLFWGFLNNRLTLLIKPFACCPSASATILLSSSVKWHSYGLFLHVILVCLSLLILGLPVEKRSALEMQQQRGKKFGWIIDQWKMIPSMMKVWRLSKAVSQCDNACHALLSNGPCIQYWTERIA